MTTTKSFRKHFLVSLAFLKQPISLNLHDFQWQLLSSVWRLVLSGPGNPKEHNTTMGAVRSEFIHDALFVPLSAQYITSGNLFVTEGCFKYTSVRVLSASLHFMGYWKAIGNTDFRVAMFYKSRVERKSASSLQCRCCERWHSSKHSEPLHSLSFTSMTLFLCFGKQWGIQWPEGLSFCKTNKTEQSLLWIAILADGVQCKSFEFSLIEIQGIAFFTRNHY